MRKSLLLSAAFLLTTSAFAMSVPAGRHLLCDETRLAAPRDAYVLASEHGERKHGEHRRYAEEDEDDDDVGGGATAQPRPADPNAPVPDNGLFNGKARPKVEVQ
jgi:hypothetical protein